MAYRTISTWAAGAGRWGHFAPQILVGAIGATVVLAVRPLPPSSVLAPLTPVLLLALVLLTWVQLRRHDRGLCEHCMASMPLNPSESAQRYRRRLATAHLGGRPRVVVGYLVVLVGAGVLLAIAPPALTTLAVVIWSVVQVSLGYLVLSHVTHRRLQPWCVQCSGGGGRDDHDAVDPVPFDFSTR